MEPSRKPVTHATHSTFRSLWGEEILDGGGGEGEEKALRFSLPSFPFSPETPDTQASSLRTADTFPVVTFRRERSDERKCVCCSQANLPLLDRRFEGANGVDRQLSNGLKFNRQPSLSGPWRISKREELVTMFWKGIFLGFTSLTKIRACLFLKISGHFI